MKKTFLNRFVFPVFFLAVFQQSLVASSNYWLVRTTTALQENQSFLFWLGIYVASLLLPYLPGAAALVLLQKWSATTQKEITDWAVSGLFGKINLWTSPSHRAQKSPLVVKEAPHWVENTCHWSYALVDSFLNFSLNILALAFLIDTDFLIAFIVGVALSAGLIWTQRKYMAKLSSELEASRADMTHKTQNFWDNILIGNRMNQQAWTKRFDASFAHFGKKLFRMESFSQIVSVALALFSNAPIFIYLFYLIGRPDTSNVEALALIVLLPRIFQIVNSSHFFLWQVTQSSALLARGRYIKEQLGDGEAASSRERVRFSQIFVNGKESRGELLLTRAFTQGRFTVTGPNGAGKSSLLMALKEKFHEKAFYLPAQSELVFDGNDVKGSTGEKMVLSLKKIFDSPDRPSILLLDEWDGNLDEGNTRRLDTLLEALAQTLTVVEVRH